VHFPNNGINFQIGAGSTIAALTGITTISDFRSVDIDLGGQGAPLVPIGDKLLFPQFDGFLNIGGFANISKTASKTVAYDISPANYALNFFAQKFDKEFDFNGNIGRQGAVNQILLDKLNKIDYYHKQPPKSLSDHWFFDVFLKIIDEFQISNKDKLRTIYEHITSQIAINIDNLNIQRIMITGGGAFNTFLIDLIKQKTTTEIIIPEKNIVQFKESIIFAFLGLLRYLGKNNCLASVTGAKYNNIGGAIYLPPNYKKI
jgi:anhydro-N-acetylmuramic acid kinase